MTERDVKFPGIADRNHLVLEGCRGCTLEQTGECLIEPGTILSTEDGARSRTVSAHDKSVTITGPSGDTLKFRVIEHEGCTAAQDMGALRRAHPHLRGVHAVTSPRPLRLPGAEMPPMFTVDMDAVFMEVPFEMILPNGYSFAGAAFSGIYVHVKSRAAPVGHVTGSEVFALESLREMLTEREYRKYLVYGFILVAAPSGRVYQVHRNRHYISVRDNGVEVEKICVYIPDMSIPPTDKLVAFKTMIETDEERFKALGNVYKMGTAA